MKSFHDSFSTPLSDSRPISPADTVVMKEEKNTFDANHERARKAANRLKKELIDKKIKVSKENLLNWMKSWFNETNEIQTQTRNFTEYLARKLSHEFLQNKSTTDNKLVHENALKHFLGKK